MQRAAPLVNCRIASDTFMPGKCGDALSMWKQRTNLSCGAECHVPAVMQPEAAL
jgi:hypothetical protein